ncbi:MAG: FG-GAP-like repeat-containing protein [Candidatus Absconditabacterales bacterium]|nr:FG-GAP-like repeat-containing protein [Candidatus Absconditabacterales bacterium]
MRNGLIKKYSIFLVLLVYAVSTFLQSFSFLDFNKVYAQESQLNYTNLVAIFVDDKIYGSLENNIERYAKTYIQGADSNYRYNAISNSKAIVLPINIDNITAPEITKILENMYFDGISGEPSKLVGVVLIGDVPLPVVNQDGFIYPTIYPYVDFEKQKFIWDDDIKYFVYNDNPKGQAEIWHGLINFDTIDQYKAYFNKLKNYAQNPENFIDKNIWYEDIVANKKYFFADGLVPYINNFLFAEDIGEKRYSDLMVKIMQGTYNDVVADIANGLNGVGGNALNLNAIQSINDNMNTPTKFIDSMVKEGYLRPYTSLMGTKHLDKIVKNVETSNRRIEQITLSDGTHTSRTALDTSHSIIAQKDETLLRLEGGLDPLIIMFNDALEKIVDDKIEQEKYRLNEIIPLTYLEYEGDRKGTTKLSSCVWKVYDAYENYFFGMPAKYINDMEQISTYRGTYRNFDNIFGLTINNIQSGAVASLDLTTVDLNKKSVGGSYDIFATQVDANRGYNINNTIKELEIYEENKIAKREYRNTTCQKKWLGICWKKRRWQSSTKAGETCDPSDEEKQGGCELPQEFAIRNRGGASPLNLSGTTDWLSGYKFQDAVLPIFDIAGSTILLQAENTANSFLGVNTYSRLIQQTFVLTQKPKYYFKNKAKEAPDLPGLGYNPNMGEDMKFTNYLATEDLEAPTRTYTEPIKANSVDFFTWFNNSNYKAWEGNIFKLKQTNTGDCLGSGKILTYKTLDSRVKNVSSTNTELYGSVYKVFEDNISPSKRFYEALSGKIEKLYNSVKNIIDYSTSTETESESVMSDLIKLKAHISGIKGRVQDISNQSISANMSTGSINNLVDQWNMYIPSNIYETTEKHVENIQSKLIELYTFVIGFGFENIEDYINNQIYTFKINEDPLVFLYDWKSNLVQTLENTKNKFLETNSFILESESIYNSINSNNLDKNQLKISLENKKIQISGIGSGCQNGSKFKSLCTTLENLILTIDNQAELINDEIKKIETFMVEGDEEEEETEFKPFLFIKSLTTGNSGYISINPVLGTLNQIPHSSNINLTGYIPGITNITADRPIDSPKYITFKGIGGDKLTFIYPNLYKAEVFSGNNSLKLKTPKEIETAIKQYLIETVKKYNEYLTKQDNKKTSFYQQNAGAYDKLKDGDKLASPLSYSNSRPYSLMPNDYLINELEKKIKDNVFFKDKMGGYEPMEFIAHLIYYQNIGRQQRKVGSTIGDDINNIIEDFDVNEKIKYSLENYLVKDNNKGPYITPAYRDNGYEVAFINSNGEDIITEKALPPFAYNISNSSNNFSKENIPNTDDSSNFLEDLNNVCGIPDDGGVLIFDINDGISSPWFESLKCWWNKTIELFKDTKKIVKVEWPISLENVLKNGLSRINVGQDVVDNFGVVEEISQYAEQWSYLNNDDSNQEILNNATAVNYQKLDKILSYTKIETNKNNINADEAVGTISLSSTVELSNVDFYIKNIGASKIKLQDGTKNISNNITEGTDGYSTGKITFDPFYKKDLSFEIQNPIAGRNVVVFYMCLPGTTNINQCVTKTISLEVIPGKIDKIEILTPGDIALQGSKFPIIVKGTDGFGNNVGQIFDGKFQISTSSGSLSSESNEGKQISFSDFNKSNFVLNVDENSAHNSQIKLEVKGNIVDADSIEVSKDITVKKGKIKVYKGNNVLTNLVINLASTNEYSYTDSFDLTQINLNTVPSIKIKLQDLEGQNINVENIVNISSKNGLIKPGEIETRKVTKTQNNNTFEVSQKRFSQNNNFTIKNGELEVYLMPSFKAGNDVISISVSGIKTVNIPVTVNPAPAKIVEINADKDVISVNSNIQANLKISDNRGNIVTKNTTIKIGTLGPLAISGINGSSANINVVNGQLDFIVKSKEQGGYGFIFGQIMSGGIEIEGQKPGAKDIVVQDKILPDKDLNIMYLNLFGNDRGNQRGFMSDNNKYIQKLINNSEKLITTTTQLTNPENIKMFSVIMSKKIEFTSLDDKAINFELDNKLNFTINDIGEINIDIANLNLQEIAVSEENLETVIEALATNKYLNKNALIYIPEKTDSIIESNKIKNNTILVNNENIFDLNNKQQNINLNIVLNNDKIAGYQSWEVKLNNKKIGTFLFVINKINDLTVQLRSNNLEYDYTTIWIDGSTNKEGVGFFQNNSKLPTSSLGYKSIQDSDDPTLGIGFTSDFKNITNFGAGQSVGEATVNFSSEFLINIGDPLLKRVNKNENAKLLDTDLNIELDSGFDKGIGETIFSEPNKTILKVINIDFNNDGLEDIIVAFTDGSVKILKNYGGTTPFKDLGDLMILADGIKEIIVGDIDGNGYKDIIIKNNSNILRAYKNDRGVFDVDGLPVCINTNVKGDIKSENPQNIGGVNQIFFEDMNNDGILDIITNDSLGYIKIFYGGQYNGKDNYVSTNKIMCDDDRYNRQINNTNMVYRFGIRINENVKVLDQSLIHRKGLNETNIEDIGINLTDLGMNTNAFSDSAFSDMFNENNKKIDEAKLNSTIQAGTTFDVSNAEEQYKGIERLKLVNFGIIPLYENNVESEGDVPYVEIGCLTGEDPVKIYKKYEDINGDVLENGDKVQVTVVLKANKNFTGTFIDNIVGPWTIPLTGETNMIENFWFEPGTISTGKVENELKFHRDMNNFRYMIDNLSMKAGDEIKIHYRLHYDGQVETQKIEIKDVDGNDYEKFGGNNGETLTNYSKDGLKDIKITPTDGCNKSLFILFNNNQGNKKSYSPEYIDLAKILARLNEKTQENFENAMSEISNTLSNGTSNGNNINLEDVPGAGPIFNRDAVLDVWADAFSWDNIVSEGGINLDTILNMPGEIIEGLAGDIMKKVDKVMGKLCDGFKLSDFGIGDGGNCGLPVPFNQAFLGPGGYHLFGCFKLPFLTETIGKGLPTLTVPGNRPSPAGYLPIPGIFGLPLKGPNDGFLGVVGGTNSSLFRLYLMPTLTAEIGIAMCFGTYNALELSLPDPFGNIAGNCLVMAVPLPCKDKSDSESQPNITNKIPEPFLDMESCSSQNVPCYLGTGESNSSFEFVSSSSNSQNMNSAIPDGSYAGGFINIEKTPVTEHGYKVESANIEIAGIKLFGGADSQNKILGGEGKGCVKELIKKRAEKQTEYILNNLTNFKLDVIFPDFEGMGSDIGAIFSGETYKLTDEQKCKNKGMKRDGEKKVCIKQDSGNQKNGNLSGLAKRTTENWISRENITDLSSSISNPFVALEQMFKDISLINIQTKNITVKVPMITSDDIVAYINMAKNWISQQEKILNKRFDLFKALIGRCGGEDEKENIKNWSDLKKAIKNIKDELQEQLQEELKGIEEQINNIEEQIEATTDPNEKEKLEEEKNKIKEQKDDLTQDVETISKQIEQIKKLNKKYNLNDLKNYEIFESCVAGEFFIRPESIDDGDQILPYDIYISYKPGANEELLMFTKGFELEKTSEKKKTKISIKKDGQKISNEGLCLKNRQSSTTNQCVELFLGGKLDSALSDFLSIQSNTQLLIQSIKQNIETLELYKKFPMELYEWVHVGERYMSDVGSLVNGFLGTISLWMKTNATRYSQYVDAIILLLTTLETYQAIIDISKNWSEKCGTCTNDEYDQFNCKMGPLCNVANSVNFPILEIPPFKIPSIILDFSRINLGIDITIPKFNFVPTSIPLPKLPSLPEPPSVDVSLDMEEALGMGIDLIGELLDGLGLNISPSIPAMPIIPAPPKLPEIPSFIPTIRLELPVLPPAPKIPKLPNTINSIINTIEAIGRLLCTVKKPIGFVKESAIKAKVEQITQRTYEVPYWDNFDQTLEQRKSESSGKIPEWISTAYPFLMANEFKNVQLKGFDIGVESSVNIQLKFDGVYDIINSLVQMVNSYSSMPGDWLQEKITVNEVDEQSRKLEKRMRTCITKPASEECLGKLYTGDLKEMKEKMDSWLSEITNIGNNIKNSFGETKKAILLIEEYENNQNSIQNKVEIISGDIVFIESEIESLTRDLEITSKEDRIRILNNEINKHKDLLKIENKKLKDQQKELEKVENKINDLKMKYGSQINAYETYLDSYTELDKEYQKLKEDFNEVLSGALKDVNDTMNSGQQILDYLHFEEIDERNEKIEEDLKKIKEKQEGLKEQRYESFGDLYKTINTSDEISYVDYNNSTYNESMESLKNGLNTILTKSNDTALNKKVKESLDIINSKQENTIIESSEQIQNLEKQYYSIVSEFQKHNDELSKLIENDYDKFLYAVANNDVSLVNNQDLNITLSSNLFETDKNYLKKVENLINTYYGDKEEKNENLVQIDKKVLLSQNNSNTNNNQANSNGGSSTVDVSQYINVIKTSEGSINLANQEYVTNFQGKSIMVDLNGDNKTDLILWDNHNIYVKYRDGNRNYNNEAYNKKYYKYFVNSYEQLFNDGEEGFIKINQIYLKMYDENREVKNFEYDGGNFDDIKISWLNSKLLGDEVDGYLIKMIHRADLFNDKEKIVNNSNKKFFDKKYMLAVPNATNISGLKIGLESGIFDIESLLTGVILDVLYYNESQKTIGLTITEIPRNRQYSQIYSLNKKDDLYYISNPSSNQVVGGPQIVSDETGPDVDIKIFRPSIQEYIDEGTNFDLYVSTKYTISSERIDEGGIKKIRIADKNGDIIKEKNNINNITGYLELNDLYFTGVGTTNYYFVGEDINGNISSTEIRLNIKKPDIEITDISKYGTESFGISSPITINAELSHDVDEAYVQFLRNRNGAWEILTGTMAGVEVNKYKVNPLQTIVTGGFYDFGDDIGLYLSSGSLAAKLNPKNGKISIESGFENIVEIELDYSNKIPIIKVLDDQKQTIFSIKLNSKELVNLDTNLETRELYGDNFGSFHNGRAIIYNNEVLLYLSPTGQIYTEELIYGNYGFDADNESVVYSFRASKFGPNLGTIKIKIKDLLSE